MKLFWNHFFHLKGKKSAMKRRAQERKSQKKLQKLTKYLNPIRFPLLEKTTDFLVQFYPKKIAEASQFTLIKRLGLWDFANLQFDSNLRRDLLLQLIATYNSRCSYVSGFRIGVNRAEFARALKLPLKKVKNKDILVDIPESKEEVAAFLEEFVLNYVIVHEYSWTRRPEVWDLPEVLNFIKLIKEGQFEKLDWPSLFWFLVERELKAAPYLGNCFYAPHMQYLMKFQRKELFRGIPPMEYDSDDFSLSDDEDCEESEGDDEDVGGEKLLRRCSNLSDDDGDMVEQKKHDGDDDQQGLHIPDVSRVDAHTVPAVAEASFLGNGKRVIDHENGISNNDLNVSNKRLRTEGQWDNKSSEFDMCMDQVQHWVGKARMLYAAKEQACRDSSMHQQVLLDALLQREDAIEDLQKARDKEQRKREMEVHRLDREFCRMENLLGGYRKDLKETNRAFAEYRARCPLPDEPLYKDASGSGGSREIEKQHLKQEEERLNRALLENKIKDFEAVWMEKFDAHKDAVSVLSNKLIDADNEVKLLKELCNRKVSGDPNEPGMSSQ